MAAYRAVISRGQDLSWSNVGRHYQGANGGTERVRCFSWSFPFLSGTERLNESFMLISRQLGAANPPEFGRRNVAQNRPTAIDDHTMRIIRECTEIDHALYADELKQFEDNIEEQLENRLETRE